MWRVKNLAKAACIISITSSMPLPASAQSPAPNQQDLREASCALSIQGKVAWSQNGRKDWTEQNLKELCTGTQNAYETVACFERGIEQHNDWQQAVLDCRIDFNSYAAQDADREDRCFDAVQGKVAWSREGFTEWAPDNIKRLCKGTLGVDATIDCFKRGIIDHNDWTEAIDVCRSNPNSYLNVRLDKTEVEPKPQTPQTIPLYGQDVPSQTLPVHTPTPYTPPVKIKETPEDICFNQVTSGVAFDRFGNSSWHPDDARSVCKGTDNSDDRIACFERGIKAHNDWKKASYDCGRSEASYTEAGPPLTSKGVTGKNVVKINYQRDGGSYSGYLIQSENDPDIWVENIDGRPLAQSRYKVLKRYENTLVLKDISINQWVWEVSLKNNQIKARNIVNTNVENISFTITKSLRHR